GARLGFAVADAEVEVATEDAGDEALLLLGAAVVHQRRAHEVQPDEGQGRSGARALVEEDVLLDRAEALAPVLARPAHTQPTVRRQLLHERPHDRTLGVAVELFERL